METKNNKDYDMFSSIINDFKEQEPKNNLNNTYKAINVDKYKKTILKENVKETSFEIKVKTQLNKKYILNKGQASYPTEKDFKETELRESLKDIGLFPKKDNQYLILRKIQKVSQQEYDNMKNNFINIDTLKKLFNYLKTINCNFKSVACNDSVGGISPLTYLIESKYQAKKEKAQEMKNKYDILQNFIMNYRTINGDGNCFYRAVMFRYLEILVLTKNIEQLQNVIFDFINSFNSEKLKSRLVIRNMNIKPDLSLKILILITDLLKNNMVEDAHQILVKSFSTCQKFDYAMILYLRYLLYDYIRQNENRTYLKNFPIKIGNLLPYQFETEDGKFLFDDFYEKYLLNFYTDAEKIVIYLTPFVLQIEIDVIIFDDNEKEILKSFKWEGNSELKTNEVISLLNHKNHYEIVYTPNDYKKYQKIFEIYENKQKPIILSEIDKYLNPDEKKFHALSANIKVLNNEVSFEDEMRCPTVIKTKRKKNILNEANSNPINGKTIIGNSINNSKINNQGANNMSRNTNINKDYNGSRIVQKDNNKDLNKINENNQKNKNVINNQRNSITNNNIKNQNNNNNQPQRTNNYNQFYQINTNNQNNINNNPNNYNNRNNQNDNNKTDGISQNNKNNRINQNKNNNEDNYINTNYQNNIQQNKYKYSYTNVNNKPNNANGNTFKINNNNNQIKNTNNSSENNNKDNKENHFSNQYENNNKLNGNHFITKTQNKSYQNTENYKRNLNNLSDNNNYDKGVNQLSIRGNQNQVNIKNEKNNSISEKNKNLKKDTNENQSNQNINNIKTQTQNNDDKNETEKSNELKKDKNLLNNTNLNDNNNSSQCNQNKKESEIQIKDSNQSNIIEDASINLKTKPLELKVGETLKNNEISKIEKDHKCMKCKNIIENNNNIDICKKCLKEQIYEFTFNFYLADISSVSVVTKIFEEQLELNLRKNEKPKKYLLPGAIKRYNEIFKDENLSQQQIINEIKKKLCLFCAEEIKDEPLELPCKCVLCCEEDLNQYLNSRDLIKEQCLCSENYSEEMLFKLGSFIIDKNIDYKNKLIKYFENHLKGACCICGKRYDLSVEDANYLTDLENNYNEFLSKLNHNFCNECYLLYTEKEFDCLICKVKHILPN